ncbi:MAG: TetR/AcrR family transcriptional regulator [Candidatus Marinimicrobia bacterium]|nr:TetR/AcrR family transcriptional regulator [Candidatus Neomarinimicrobiota bacterium]
MNTKEKIQKVAIKMFAEKGYTETSLRKIANELNISKPALYYHFTNKEEIFTSIIRNIFDENIKYHKELAKKDIPTWDILRQWIDKTIYFAFARKEVWQVIHQIMMGKFQNKFDDLDLMLFIDTNFNILHRVIKNGIKNGEIRNDIDSKILTINFLSSINSVLGPMRSKVKKIDSKKISEMIYKILYNGMKK